MASEELDRDLCKLIHRFAHRMDVQARRVADSLGMTASQVIALRELSEPITSRELAERMSCEPSNVTFVLDKLEQQALVERRPHPTDRRARQLMLTAAGKRRRAMVVKRLGDGSPVDGLTIAQQEALRDLLQRAAEAS
jgi:DNA-binding MarR family transcriptional regulator